MVLADTVLVLHLLCLVVVVYTQYSFYTLWFAVVAVAVFTVRFCFTAAYRQLYSTAMHQMHVHNNNYRPQSKADCFGIVHVQTVCV